MAQRSNIADLYPLAPLQRGLLFHSLYAPEAAQYFEQLTCRLAGRLDPARFVAAWQAMVDRHPILRSAFLSQSVQEPMQVVMKRAELRVQQLDWRDAPAGEQARRFEEFVAADQAAGFALHRPPLVRIALIRVDDETFWLVVSHHHLLLDGWSLPILLGELFAVYHAAGRGRAAALPEARPYGDYIAWLGRQDRAAADAFWRATLGDFTEPTPLAVDLRAAEPGRPADRVITRIARLDDARTAALRALAQDASVTLNTVIQAAWALVLGRHGRTSDVVFGVTVSGRPPELRGADQMVGLFINTLPLRLRIAPDQPIRDWLPEIQRRQSDLQRFSYTSLTDAHGQSGVPRDQPLFRSLYAFENFPLGEALDSVTGEIQIRDARLAEKTNYPLTLVVVPSTGLEFKLSYDCDRIPDALASGMLAQLDHVLAELVAWPDAPARAISLCAAPPPRAIAALTGTGPVADAPSLAAAWRAAVRRFADRIAITFGDEAWTYRALDARAAAVAEVLAARGAGPDTTIGLCAERSADLVAAMLGTILTGAAYVPLDPRYPAERLRLLARDSGCLAVLASAEAAAHVGALACPVIDLASILDPGSPGACVDRPMASDATREHPAYIIYTSGSTGEPKGVVVTQGNLLRLFSSTHLWFGFDEHDVWTFFHSFAFDFSVWELWGALLHGGRVVVVSYAQSRDPDAFYELIARERVTVLNQTPSAFAELMAAEDRRAAPLPLHLRTVVFGGEALDAARLAPWFARHGDRAPRLINMYGITETTVHVTYRPISVADTTAPGSRIGRPIPDLEIWLCDEYGHPVPDGVPGEICVAGAGVSRGYLNRPELTAERFVSHPVATDPGATLYRSGDLGRRLPDGDLEYLGRIDFQVKVRGFRIELAEIEHALATHAAVARAVVVAIDDGPARRLAAYLVVRPDSITPTATELREHLRRTLPDHMVPELYVALDAFPLTLQGKIDRRALPDPHNGRIAAARVHAAPETPAQAALCRIWQEVLDVAEVGIDDDYFALGGDSIRAIRVVALAGKAGLAITLRELFADPTPRRLADAAGSAPRPTDAAAAPALPTAPFALISAADRAALPEGAAEGAADGAAEPASDGVIDAYPLARLQAGMLFHSDSPADGRLYHDVFAFRLRLPHDEAAWRASVRCAIAVHPVLRTSFHFDGYTEPLQLVHRTIEPPIRIEDLRGLDPATRAARLDAWFDAERRAGYDWAQPGLWRLGLARIADDVCEVVIAWHHAILDGWSLATLMAELAEHYLAALGHRSTPRGALPPARSAEPPGSDPTPTGDAGLCPSTPRAALPPAPSAEPPGSPLPIAGLCPSSPRGALPPAPSAEPPGSPLPIAGLCPSSPRGALPPAPSAEPPGSPLPIAGLCPSTAQLPLDDNAFRDFIALERHSEADAASRAFWDARLADAPLTQIPRWPGGQRGGRITVNRTLERAVSAALRGHAAAARLPLRTLVLAIHARALALLAGETDIVTGVVENGRPETAEGARSLGLFLNTAPLRLRLAPEASWLELARAVHDAERAALPHRRFPMAALRRVHGELFATSFNYVHFHVYERLLAGGDVQLLGSRAEESIDIPFGVTFSTEAASHELHLALSVDTHAIAPAQAEAVADLYLACAAAMARDPATSIEALDGLAPSRLDGAARAGGFEPVHVHVTRRAAETPDAIALELGERVLSRADLERAAAHIAARLAGAGLAPGQPVVLCFERSFALVAALLAVVRAGGAYAPVAADAPPGRIAEILAQLDAPLVLAGATEAARLPAGARVLVVDEPGRDPVAPVAPVPGGDGHPAPVSIRPEQPAYVLFTSGSTGAQRGVVVPHGALAHHMAWFLDAFPLDDSDVILQKTPATFDASVWEFWAALMSGARLRLARPDGHRDAQYLAAELARGRVTVLQLIPSVLDRVLDEPRVGQPGDIGALRYLFCGGEALRMATAARASAAFRLPVTNLYGPTEATIQCSFDEVHARDASSSELAPLGRPIDGTTLSVRDPALRVVPVGVPGELCVAGPCLALGYWKAPSLTAERFAADPAAPDRRLLRTGDRARILPDGTLQFLGRLDDQLKIRGTRVEPGEIEARLAALPGVAQAVVAARPGPAGALQLVAWIELAAGATPPSSWDGPDAGAGDPAIAALRTAIAAQLPDAMMPGAWVRVDHWPRLPSGKVDRRALPAPTWHTRGAAIVPPRPGPEAVLAAIWRRVLAAAEVSASDDFFALGGDSILAMQMVAQARGQGLAIGVRDVFSRPVLRELAAWTARDAANPAPIADPCAASADELPTGEVPLTAAQRWFLELDLPAPRHWNHAVLLGLPPEIAAAEVERAVRAVICRRDAFGLRLVRDDRGVHQIVGGPAGEPVFEAVDLGAAGDPAIALRDHAAAVQTCLVPEAGQLCRAVHYDLGPGRGSRLLVVCHHLIVDGLSWRLLLQDLALALAGAALPAAGSFARCAHRLAELAQSPELDAELGFWQAQLDGVTALPLDTAADQGANREGAAREVAVALPEATTRRLLEDAPAALRATPHEILLAAFAHAMAAWTGPRVSFLLESHGRARLADRPDAADAVGWLTALYPVRVDLPAQGATAIAGLPAVKAALRAIPADGSGYGMLRYQRGAAGLRGRAEPAIAVNYLGRIDGSFEGTPFTRAREDVGPSIDPDAPRPRAIDVVLHVESGRLHASWQFCPALHHEATIAQLARRFTDALEALCAGTDPGAQRQALASSDFPLAQIRDEDLARVWPSEGGLTDLLPLAPVQEGMLFHALHDPARGVYVQQVVAELTGALDRARLERAWLATLAAHPMLRASFVSTGLERPLQRIHDRVTVPLALLDLSPATPAERSAALDRFLAQDRQRGFALDQPPLMRLTLVREAEATWRLVWTHHHLLLDGWSLPIVFRDFLSAYDGGAALPSRPGAGAYADFLRWLHRRDRDADARFWCEALRDFPGATAPRSEPPAVPQATADLAVDSLEARAVLPAQLAGALERAARHWRVTVATLFQAAWALVLGRHGGTDDVVFGVTLSGRPDDVPGAATAVGTYINTLPLRVRLPAHQPIADWLAALRTAGADVLGHQASALVDVARWADLPGGTPLFEAILVHENYPVGEARSRGAAGPLAITRVTARENNHYPLSLYVLPGADGIALALYYQTPRFTAELAGALLAQVARVLEQLAAPDLGHVGDLVLASRAETTGLATFNATARPLERAWPVHARIRARAAAAPDAIAVIADDTTLTYRELGARCDAFARRLAALGVGDATAVGICMRRSADMVVAMLAILEVGGCYVPLDPAFPDLRLAAMLDDAAPAYVVTEPAQDDRLRALGARLVHVTGGADLPRATEPRPPRAAAPESLAYVIFTSGSTGRPKAVMVPHGALTNLLDSFAREPGLAADDRLLAVTTLAFDIAALELLLPLVVGATVVIAGTQTTTDPVRLAELMVRSRATVMQATPATWRMLLAAGWPALQPGFRVWCGGEALTSELAAALLERGVALCNVYGPTETTIWSTLHGARAAPSASRVGLPIANTTCYVLDPAGNPVPPGIPGELVIGGAGVARGYLGQPALTAERFVPDPFSGVAGARLYRTGDLARRHGDGRLEILGRLDFQVKVRGFRVELGEIEAALAALPEIAQAVVVASSSPGGDVHLVAHLIAAQASPPPSPAQLREQLAARLPAYMIPAAWRYVAAYPLTANHKIDRTALVACSGDHARAAGRAPHTALERALAEIWKQVLGVARVDADDGFFELGGHSLTAVRVHAQVREVFRVDLPLAALLRHPTVAGLAALVDSADPEPGRSARVAAAYLRVLAMTDEDKARLRDRRSGNGGAPS